MFVDLDGSLNASHGLSASAELLVYRNQLLSLKVSILYSHHVSEYNICLSTYFFVNFTVS